MNTNKGYLTTFLKELLLIPSPTGDTQAAIQYVENEFANIGIQLIAQ